jgi:hypothetical protein
MLGFHEVFEVQALDEHVLAHGVELSLVQACCEGTDAQEELVPDLQPLPVSPPEDLVVQMPPR